jgi:hypothetical protein
LGRVYVTQTVIFLDLPGLMVEEDLLLMRVQGNTTLQLKP